jgi:hypothetical protein
MHPLRAALTVVAVCAALTIPAAPAFAAAPSNDTSGGATAVSLGFTQTLDTSEATTDAEDAQANASCGAPATDASVWYTYTAATDGGVIVDMSGSDYSAGAIVATGSPGALDLVSCGPGSVAFAATTGTTYYILVFDDQLDGTGNGGTLELSVSAAPPPPTLDVTVDPVGVAHKDGTASFTGTYTCTDGDFVDIFGEVAQTVGRFIIRGSFAFSDEGTCDGETHTWSAVAFGDNGKFSGGRTATITFFDSCNISDCVFGSSEQTVKLRRGR